MGKTWDFNTVHCYASIAEDGNNTFFDTSQTRELIVGDIENYFKKYGLNYEIHPPGGKGGGGAETFWNLFKLAWDNKQVIGIVLFLLKKLVDITRNNFYILHVTNSKLRPKVSISLNIELYEDSKWMLTSLSNRLINLKHISDDLCKELSIKYPIFKFNQLFGLSFFPYNFFVKYELRAERQNGFNSMRLMRLFKNLRIRKYYNIRYSFINWFAIMRYDIPGVEMNGKNKSSKKYYFFFSTNIISDYFNSSKT